MTRSIVFGGVFVCTLVTLVLMIPLVHGGAPNVTTNGISPMPTLQRIN
jgi:hypothetical protein